MLVIDPCHDSVHVHHPSTLYSKHISPSALLDTLFLRFALLASRRQLGSEAVDEYGVVKAELVSTAFYAMCKDLREDTEWGGKRPLALGHSLSPHSEPSLMQAI